jgi:PAS domain S-box-containing protein
MKVNSQSPHRFPFHIIIIYFLVSSAWILLSDLMLDQFVPELYRASISIAKGWLFILVTSLLLAHLLNRYHRARELLERRFREIVDNLPIVLYVFDREGRAVLLNRAMVDLCGLGSEDYRGRSRESLGLAPAAAAEHRANDLLVFETGRPIIIEESNLQPDGLNSYHTVKFPLTGSDGSIEAVCGVSTNITERKRVQEAIGKLNEELEERVRERTGQLEVVNKELEAFSYSVSHDLKAPLRGIDGYSRLLEADYCDRLDAEGRLFIRNIRASAAQMHQLIEDLLNYSRMERRILQRILIDLPVLIQAVVAERAVEIEQAGVQLHLEIPPLTVHADRDGLTMALRNLLENALKFSRNADPSVVEIHACQEQNRVILSVRDNGIGFDMKYHDRIFDIFQRLQRSEDYPGTGIGLALVRRAMQRMGGKAWAESAPGKGAIFFLEVPCDN